VLPTRPLRVESRLPTVEWAHSADDMHMRWNPAGGLVYVVAAGEAAFARDEARAVAARLIDAANAGGEARSLRGEQREVAGALWGFVPFERDDERPGDRLTHARRGRLEAILRGDPIWLEPWSHRPPDAEELAARWENEGKAAAKHIDNISFALVADSAAGELAMVTDRMGGISLYTAAVRGLEVFSTSYIALSRLVETKAVDEESIGAFLHLGYFPGRRTALRDVSVHPYATVTTIRAGRVETTPYWRPNLEIDRARPRDEQLRAGVDAFNTTVRESCAGRSQARLAITAGLDSRSVASSLLRQRIAFDAYTHGFPGCWEGKRVEKIVRRHGIPHRFVPLVESFTSRIGELALESFRASEGTISCIEKSHLLHVLSAIRADARPDCALLLGEGAGMLKGTYYRLLHDEEPYTPASVDRYIAWNFAKRLPDIFSPEVAAGETRGLEEFVTRSLDEAGGGTFFQRLDYLYAVRYRRWAGGVKSIYRRFFPVRAPFVSARLIEYLFPLDPAMKGAQLPHFAILESNHPALQRDLTNKMTPALPLTLRTFPRFLPSVWWRTKQVIRGFSRQYLPREIFPLIDYVDYKSWIRSGSGRALVEELLDPQRMKSARLYDERKLRQWIASERQRDWSSFPLVDKMCTLELYFREIEKS
jgi:hypothetical protein